MDFMKMLPLPRFCMRLDYDNVEKVFEICEPGSEVVGLGLVHGIITDFGKSTLHRYTLDKKIKNVKKFLDSNYSLVDEPDEESGCTPLVTACFMGHLNMVKLFVERGANVNHKCSGINKEELKYSDVTPLHIAAEQGHKEVIKYLIVKGADVNHRCSLGYTPLFRAVVHGQGDAAGALVSLGADVNIPINNGVFPLFVAIKRRDFEMLQTLLSSPNVDVNAVEPTENLTALHWAAYVNDMPSAYSLLKHGAKVNALMIGGFTPMDLALQKDHNDLVKLLKQFCGRQHNKHKSWLPFAGCVIKGLDTLKAAVDRGVAVDAPFYRGGTALHFNVVANKLDVCKFLLENGANVHARDSFGKSPIFLAAMYGHSSIVSLLLDKGAEVDAATNTGHTPIFAAAAFGFLLIAKLLISKGANLNVQVNFNTPLLLSLTNNHLDMCKLLLRKGVNPNLTILIPSSEVKSSAFHFACSAFSHHTDIIKAFIDAGADVNEPVIFPNLQVAPLHILSVCSRDNSNSFRLLIESGAHIDAGNIECTATKLAESGNASAFIMLTRTLQLFKAVRKNDVRLIEAAFRMGGLVNCCSKKFYTPLTYASWKGYVDVVKFLLANGASITVNRRSTASPLHYAAKYNQKQIVLELLKKGAQPNVLCCNKTALEMAEEAKHPEIVTLLKFIAKWYDFSDKGIICQDRATKSKFINLLKEVDSEVLKNDLGILFGLS